MKRILTLLLQTLLVLPVLAEGGLSQVKLADPYILVDGGKYYAYGTYDGDGIHCYSSTDLRQWTDEGQALNKSNTTETQWFWAPEVYHIGDRYIMYYSANEHLYAATGTSPKGPFKQVGSYQMDSLLGDEKCIDSHVFFDDDGTAYIFFVRFTDGNCIWQAELEDDYITPKVGTLRLCFAASQDWELKKGRVNEGPNVIKVGKKYFLTYSGNDYQSQDYAVGYATTTNIAKGTWTKNSLNPILRRWDDLVGVGHHSIFTDLEGITRIVFHAHDSNESIHPRRMYIGTLIASSTKLMMSQEPIIRPTLQTESFNPELVTQSLGFQNGGAVTADVDNDGNLDLITGGSTNQTHNDAADSFTSHRLTTVNRFIPSTHKWQSTTQKPPFDVAASPSLLPCDIDGDGLIDIIAFESVGTDVTHEAYTGGYGSEGIFLGTGSGQFTAASLVFTHPDGTPCPFDIKGPSSADILDMDNDGRLDIVCTGHQGDTNYNVILHNQGKDDSGIHFTVEPYETELQFSDAIVQAADLNNDGYPDFVVSTHLDNVEGQTCLTEIYLNDTLQHDCFSRQHQATIKHLAGGSLQLADFNGDGWIDIYIAGLGEPVGSRATASQRIYTNKQNTLPTFAVSANPDLVADAYDIASAVPNSTGVIDWNNDGFPDLIVGGYKGSAKSTSGQLYLNDGKGRLSRSIAMPGCAGASVVFPDYNGDGRKDLLLYGLCTDSHFLTTDQQGVDAVLCYNLLPTPQRPEPPTDCQVEVGDDGTVTLSWQAPASLQGCCTYEVYILDSLGRQVNSTPAIIDGNKDGIRKVNRMGRVTTPHWEFHPQQPGTYTWGVQTVDAAYNGSTFTAGPAFQIDGSTAVSAVRPADISAPAYDLSGRRADETTRGIIIRQGRKVQQSSN